MPIAGLKKASIALALFNEYCTSLCNNQTILYLISGSLIMVAGGWDGNKYQELVQIIDVSTFRKVHLNLQNYPIPVAAATGAIVSGVPVICGGYSYSAYASYPQVFSVL